MGKTNRTKHVKVSHKDTVLKRKIEEPKEKIKDPEDLIDAEGFICLPASEEVPEEVENELQAFRANRVTFNTELSEKLKDTSSLDPKIKDVYSKVGKILRGYRSGKLPNAFKIIPGLEKWMEILELTSPDDWSPQAVYQATKIFVSSMGPKQSQKFLYRTLYNAAKKDIQKHKKLNYHHYLALKKAFYKPAAWIRGILFPLCEEDCTLKEATIIGSVISKVCAWH
ncbi:unnamed protein product [Blepharisma stoltei]|uniref:Bystin n=1 Tax=Blepharisma stoltei TaxID=1481888 RepID=A0AAU9ISU9_9CILI|nr:unnamed protein product [Blepharisma stoltei]